MELRTGPGGNQDEVARKLRESLINVTTTEHQLRAELDKVRRQLAALPPEPPATPPPTSGVTPVVETTSGAETATEPADSTAADSPGNDSPPSPADAPGSLPVAAEESGAINLVGGLPPPPPRSAPRVRLEVRQADLESQLGDVQAAKEEIAEQLRNLPATLASAEVEGNILAVRQLLAAGGIDDLDREALEPLAELSTLSVDEELAALRREMGLEPPTPTADPASPEDTPPSEPTSDRDRNG